MQEVWYILEDGSNGDPNDCAPDAAGRLRHKSGIAVALHSSGVPRSRGVDGEAERAKAAARKAKAVKPEEPKPGYKTRETKAE